MYTAKVIFKINNFDKDEEQEEFMELLIGFWRMNGQILGREHLWVREKDFYSMYLYIPEKISLSEEFNNKYTQDRMDNLEKIGLEKPIIIILDYLQSDSLICTCDKISEYILYTTYNTFAPPLRCKKCFKAIPLYYLPKLYDNNDYYPLITWQSDYQACDSLQMNCSVGVRFGLKQMGSIDSQLTKAGLEVCRDIEKLTGRNTYYYLYKYSAKSKKQELLRKCPKCGGEWLLDKPLHDIFDFECKKCKLLSNIGWDKR